MTLHEALHAAAQRIPRRDAEVLLAHTLHRNRAWLLAHATDPIDDTSATDFLALVTRRANHEPLQYLTGAVEFFGLPLTVTPATLIPRPETEHLVEAVLAWAHGQSQTQSQPLHVLDVGTGSGAIAIALARQLPHANLSACDLSVSALLIATHNAARNSVNIDLRESDLLAAYAAELAQGLRFDAIISNPPYVPIVDAPTLVPEVRDHEPHSALFAGTTGLDVYRRLIPQAYAALRPGGLLAMEIGFGQREAVTLLLQDWNNVRFLDDYAGIPRVALAEKPASA